MMPLPDRVKRKNFTANLHVKAFNQYLHACFHEYNFSIYLSFAVRSLCIIRILNVAIENIKGKVFNVNILIVVS